MEEEVFNAETIAALEEAEEMIRNPAKYKRYATFREAMDDIMQVPDRKCPCCKADTMEESTNAYFAHLKNGYVIIENVPCLKCAQCGEVLYASDTLEKIDVLLEGAEMIASRILIVDYQNAA